MKKRKFSNWIGPIFLIVLLIVLDGWRDGKEDRKAAQLKQIQNQEIRK